MGTLKKETGDLVTKEKEKAEVIIDLLASVFSDKGSSHTELVADSNDKNLEKEDLPAVCEDQVLDHLKNLEVHKSVGPNKIYPQVLRELVDEVAKMLCIIFEGLWQFGEIHTHWKRGNITPLFKKGKKRRSRELQDSLNSVPDKIMEHILRKVPVST